VATETGINRDDALAFMVAAGLVYEIVAAVCSSPQTAEINADKRAATLMKWVNLGLIQAGLFVAIAAFIAKKSWPTILGGALAGGLLAVQYQHAKQSGLSSGQAGTETY
jgi:aryl-alcohol dehydrogenase-like predicted oxidoreductase